MEVEYIHVMIDIYYSDRFLQHDTGYGHPERAERLEAIVSRLKDGSFPDVLHWKEPRRARREELSLIHTANHIDTVERTAIMGGFSLDPDTMVSPESFDVALQSAGAWLEGVDTVLDERRSAFVLSRPPGHHAERDHAAGFCLFSNCALAATYALEEKGVDRVAVLDWDVHHGNGTQHILETDRRAAYCSLHQWPYYPGTGAAHEKGNYSNVLNIPMEAGSGRSEYLQAFENEVIPFLRAFEPELLLISAGFDASVNDPLAGMNLTPEEFSEFTLACLDLNPRLMLGLEGGYHLQDLADCVARVLTTIEDNDQG